MSSLLVKTYVRLKDWFQHSTTILWARLQVLLAAFWAVLGSTDLAPVLSPKWLTAWLIVSGMVTELTRRRTLTPSA
jgi:hypothetical protein